MYTIFALGLGIGFGLGIILSSYSVARAKTTEPKSYAKDIMTLRTDEPKSYAKAADNGADTGKGPMKLLLAVRTDLKMGKGKIAAQCGHAAVGAYQACGRHRPKTLRAWELNGAAKIAVKVADEEELTTLARSAEQLYLLTYIVHDAGRTQIAPNSKTVLAIGPGPVETVDKVAAHLKLL
eukprot:g17498.t1